MELRGEKRASRRSLVELATFFFPFLPLFLILSSVLSLLFSSPWEARTGEGSGGPGRIRSLHCRMISRRLTEPRNPRTELGRKLKGRRNPLEGGAWKEEDRTGGGLEGNRRNESDQRGKGKEKQPREARNENHHASLFLFSILPIFWAYFFYFILLILIFEITKLITPLFSY